jgi:hypothetical protein
MTDNTKLIALIRKTPQYGAESRTDLLGLARLAADALDEAERKIAELEQGVKVNYGLYRSATAALTEPAEAQTAHEQPHSRACGIQRHEHGTACHSSCPSCGGRTYEPAKQDHEGSEQ